MNKYDIFEALNDIDDKCIINAKEKVKDKKPVLVKYASVAACFCVLAAVICLLVFGNSGGVVEFPPSETPSATPMYDAPQKPDANSIIWLDSLSNFPEHGNSLTEFFKLSGYDAPSFYDSIDKIYFIPHTDGYFAVKVTAHKVDNKYLVECFTNKDIYAEERNSEVFLFPTWEQLNELRYYDEQTIFWDYRIIDKAYYEKLTKNRNL